MSTSQLVSLAHRGRHVSPSTLTHVLQLVSGYMDTNTINMGYRMSEQDRLRSRGRLFTNASASSSRRQGHSRLQQRSYASVAHAYQTHDDDYHDPAPSSTTNSSSSLDDFLTFPAEKSTTNQHFPMWDDRPKPSSSKPLNVSPSPPPQRKHKQIKSVLYSLPTPTKVDRLGNSQKLPPNPIKLDPALADVLSISTVQAPSNLISAFEKARAAPSRLATTLALPKIYRIWGRTSSVQEWEWLATKLGEAMMGIRGDSRVTASVRNTTSALRVVALLRSAEGKAKVAQRSDADLLLKETLESRRARGTPFELALTGLALALLRRWDDSRTQLAFSLERGLLVSAREGTAFHPVTQAVFGAYRHELVEAGRLGDLHEIFWNCSPRLARAILKGKGTPLDELDKFHRFWYEVLGSVPNPQEWLRSRIAKEQSDTAELKSDAFLLAVSRNPACVSAALKIFNYLRNEKLSYPVAAAFELARSLSRDERLDSAIEVLRNVREDGKTFTHRQLHTVMMMLIRFGRLAEAEDVQKEIIRLYTPSPTDRIAMATVFANRGDVDETRKRLKETYGPAVETDPAALYILQRAFIAANHTEDADMCLGKILAGDGDDFRLKAINTQLSHYAHGGNVDRAVQLFGRALDLQLEPDNATYTTLITLFARLRDIDHARQIIRSMLDSGITVDPVTWAAVLYVDIRAGNMVEAVERYQTLPATIKKHSSIAAVILHAMVRIAAPIDITQEVFRRIDNANPRQWALAIQSVVDQGDMTRAWKLVDEMAGSAKQPQSSNPAPDVYHYSILLHEFLRRAMGPESRKVYDEMLRLNIIPSSVTYAAIINSFAQAKGRVGLEQAQDFAWKIHNQAQTGGLPDKGADRSNISTNLFSPIITAAGKLRHSDTAKEYFDVIVQDKTPSIVTLTQLLDAYRYAADVPKVSETWDRIYQLALDSTNRDSSESVDGDSAIKPDRSLSNILCIPLSIVLDSLSSVGRYDDIKRIWGEVRDSGFGFDAGNYNHFAVALARTGDIETAFYILERILIPRQEEVESRVNKAVRQSPNLTRLPSADEIDPDYEQSLDPTYEVPDLDIDDRPVDSPAVTMSRRHGPHYPDPYGHSEENSSRAEVSLETKTTNLLATWNHHDTRWKPSYLTLSVIEHAYTQLEDSRRRAGVLGIVSEDEDADLEQDLAAYNEEDPEAVQAQVTFPSYNNAPLRDPRDGKPRKITAAAMITRLRFSYKKAFALMIAHRRLKRSRGRNQEKLERFGLRPSD